MNWISSQSEQELRISMNKLGGGGENREFMGWEMAGTVPRGFWDSLS